MVSLFPNKRSRPIGVDLGSRSIKMLQFDADGRRLIEAVRWDLPAKESASADDEWNLADDDAETPQTAGQSSAELAQAVARAREGRNFRGRDAVLCLGADELFIQNVRVPSAAPEELKRLVMQEAASRIPFPISQAEIRFVEAADVRQGDAVRREVIVIAAQQPDIERRLQVLIQAGLRPVAVDVEPIAMLRCYANQFRRDADRHQRAMFVHVGVSQTAVVIAQGADILFIKYINIGGRQLDEAVAQGLAMDRAAAAALRRHNGDRRSDQQDPEVSQSIADVTRPVIDRLANELALCVRYNSVTFRGKPLTRMVLGGGEASSQLIDAIGDRFDVKCELGDPLRSYQATLPSGRAGQWDIAAGLALRNLEPVA